MPAHPRVPPVLVMLLAGALMWGAARLAPELSFHLPGRWIIATVCAAAGLCIATLGVVSFHRAGTTVNPMDPGKASALVTTGVYAHTRNPMYLGLLLLLLGWAVALRHWLAFAVLPVFVAYLNRFQIGPEERALAAHFGEPFTQYQRRVRRWL